MKLRPFANDERLHEVQPQIPNGKSPAPPEPQPTQHRPSENVPNVRLAFYSDLKEYGKNRAIESGALEVTDEALRPLIEHALAMAKDALWKGYDPKTFVADLIREQEFKKVQKDRGEAEIAVKHAMAHLEELESARAKIKLCGSSPAAPAFSWKVGGAIAIGVTVAVALHDQILPFSDEITSWFVSGLVGLSCGWFIVNLILSHPTTATFETNRWAKWVGVIAGVGFGLGFFAVRLAQANSFAGVLIAFGLTVVEIAAVLGLHALAGRYSQELKQWREEEKPYLQITERVEVAKAHLEVRKHEYASLEQKVEQYKTYLDERQLRSQQRTEIEELAVKGIVDGYHEGVAINLGRIRGVRKGGQK